MVSQQVSYLAWLQRTKTNPMRVGSTMVVSSTSGQIETTVALDHRISNKRIIRDLHPTIDPLQTQTDRVVDRYEYLFDGSTKLVIQSLAAFSTVYLRLYPMEELTPTQIVAGGGVEKEYECPLIEKTGTVVLKKIKP